MNAFSDEFQRKEPAEINDELFYQTKSKRMQLVNDVYESYFIRK